MKLSEAMAGIASAMLLTAGYPADSIGEVPSRPVAQTVPMAQTASVPALTAPGSEPIVVGRMGTARAVLATEEEADGMRKAAELMPLPEVPAGSDLDKLLSGSTPAGGSSVASPLAHGSD